MAAAGEIPTTVLHALADGSCRTIDQLDVALDLSRRQISNGAASLILRGYAERVEAGCYQLTPAGSEAAERGETIKPGPWRPDTGKIRKPQQDTLRQRAWNAMRMSATFTIGDIVMAAARDDADPESNVQRYLRHLKNAGYVAELPTRQRGTHLTSNGFKRFRLIRDTGPSAPAYRAGKNTIHDYNLREDVPCGRNP